MVKINNNSRKERIHEAALAKAAAKLAENSVMKVDLGTEGAKQLLAVASELRLDGPKAVLDRSIETLRILHRFHRLGSKVYAVHQDGSANEIDMFSGLGEPAATETPPEPPDAP